MSVANSATDTAAIKALVESAQNVPCLIKDSKGRDILLRPTGSGQYATEILTPAEEVERKPLYINQRPKLQTTTSMITYLNRFKTPESMLFADVDKSMIVAAIDYHHEASKKPGLVQHQAVLTLPHSLQWDTWMASNSEMMTQKEFAEFIQENFRDFDDPIGIDVLAAILSMEKTAVLHIGRAMRRAGSDQGSEVKNVEISGSDFPPEWKLQIPVYRGEDHSNLLAYCRDKIVDGENLYGYKLATPERVKEDAFFAIAARIAEKTTVPVVLGSIG